MMLNQADSNTNMTLPSAISPNNMLGQRATTTLGNAPNNIVLTSIEMNWITEGSEEEKAAAAINREETKI